MNTDQLGEITDGLAEPVLLQRQAKKIIKNFHLIIFKFIIICATVAIVASFVYVTIPFEVATQFRCNPPPKSGGSRHLIPVQSATPCEEFSDAG